MKNIKMIGFWSKYYAEYILSQILLWTRQDDHFLTEEKYHHIMRCAKLAYSGETLYFYSKYDEEEIISQMRCSGKGQIYVFVGNDWYMLLARRFFHFDILDFASATGKCQEIWDVYARLKETARGKKAKMICREKTSYPLVKSLARHGRCRILKEEKIILDDETDYLVVAKIIR